MTVALHGSHNRQKPWTDRDIFLSIATAVTCPRSHLALGFPRCAIAHCFASASARWNILLSRRDRISPHQHEVPPSELRNMLAGDMVRTDVSQSFDDFGAMRPRQKAVALKGHALRW